MRRDAVGWLELVGVGQNHTSSSSNWIERLPHLSILKTLEPGGDPVSEGGPQNQNPRSLAIVPDSSALELLTPLDLTFWKKGSETLSLTTSGGHEIPKSLPGSAASLPALSILVQSWYLTGPGPQLYLPHLCHYASPPHPCHLKSHMPLLPPLHYAPRLVWATFILSFRVAGQPPVSLGYSPENSLARATKAPAAGCRPLVTRHRRGWLSKP